MKYVYAAALIWLAASLTGMPAHAGAIKDTESASHGDAASQYQIVDTYDYPGFSITQFTLGVLSHYSYMLVSQGQALVVDPGRDVVAYQKAAADAKAKIAGILLTHSHADFVAGHTELASREKCPVYISARADAGYPHTPLKDGFELTLGQARLRVLETPGHTLDCTTTLVMARDNATPLALFTGDTLFVGSIGRPDLMGGTISAAALAAMSYETWHTKLAGLPDPAVVYPAHGAGSLCGAHLSDDPYSTIGREKQTNPYLKYTAKSDFIAAVLDGLPDAPQYFKHNAAMNRQGPPMADWEGRPPTAAPDISLTDPAKAYVVDLRDAALFSAGHIPNSVNIGLRGRLETWTGIMVPWGSPLVLTGSGEEIKEAAFRLNRVGYTARSLAFEDWVKAGLPVTKTELMDPQALYSAMQAGSAPIVVDVRLPAEWMGLRIGQVINMPLNRLGEMSAKLDPAQPVVAVCNSAYRSSMALGILEQKGFTRATSLKGGSQAWIDAGYPVLGPDTAKGQGTAAPGREIRLPGRISPRELNSLIMDLPGTFDLVDIRPPQFFADFSLPGAVNVDLADLLENPAYLAGKGPLVIVDRNGTLAMVAAGILFTKTRREIKALTGGLEAYWTEAGPMTGPMHGPIPGSGVQPAAQTAPKALPQAAPVGPTQPPAAPPSRPAKKSAGC